MYCLGGGHGGDVAHRQHILGWEEYEVPVLQVNSLSKTNCFYFLLKTKQNNFLFYLKHIKSKPVNLPVPQHF